MSKIREAAFFRRLWEGYKENLKTIELREWDDEFGGDELVAQNASVHLERMDESHYFLGISTASERLLIWIGSDSGRAKVSVIAYEANSKEAPA